MPPTGEAGYETARAQPLVIAALRGDAPLLGYLTEATPPTGVRPPGKTVASQISGQVRPPYPCIRVVTTPGGTGPGHDRWASTTEIMVEAWGDAQNPQGVETLETIIKRCQYVVGGLDKIEYQPWETVVTDVDMGAAYPLADGADRARWLFVAGIALHPAVAPASAPYQGT